MSYIHMGIALESALKKMEIIHQSMRSKPVIRCRYCLRLIKAELENTQDMDLYDLLLKVKRENHQDMELYEMLLKARGEKQDDL